MDAIKDNAYSPATDHKSEPAYQIGKTEDNRTTLRIGNSGYSNTLTMNDTGVRQLIRMLESAINGDEDEAV